VWNEKADLLRRGMELNPFNSEHFYWVDMGSIRKPTTLPWSLSRMLTFQKYAFHELK
jgi:hypothetical protein